MLDVKSGEKTDVVPNCPGEVGERGILESSMMVQWVLFCTVLFWSSVPSFPDWKLSPDNFGGAGTQLRGVRTSVGPGSMTTSLAPPPHLETFRGVDYFLGGVSLNGYLKGFPCVEVHRNLLRVIITPVSQSETNHHPPCYPGRVTGKRGPRVEGRAWAMVSITPEEKGETRRKVIPKPSVSRGGEHRHGSKKMGGNWVTT